MSSNEEVFQAFIDRYPQTNYGDVSTNREMSFDQRTENPLKVMQRGAMQAYIPNLLSEGSECEGLVFDIVRGKEASSFVDSFSSNLNLLPNTNKGNEDLFACKCYILSAPTTIMINFKKCREGDPRAIGMLPTFYGSVDELKKPPKVGDVLRVKYYEAGWTAGSVIGFRRHGGETLNMNASMWLDKDNVPAMVRLARASRNMSAYDLSHNFEEKCNNAGQSKFHAATLRPSFSIIKRVLGWEGYRSYVYDMSRRGRGLWQSPKSGEWDVRSHKNHSGFISSYSEAAGDVAIGVGHIIPQDQRASYAVYLKGNTSIPQYSPGADNAGLTSNQAYELLKEDMYTVADEIRGNITVPLTQNQFDALCSLAFNIGAPAFNSSTVLAQLNAGECDLAAKAFLNHSRTSDPDADNLVLRRRKAEARMFAGTEVSRDNMPTAGYDHADAANA